MGEKLSLSVIDAAANGNEITPEQANVLDNILYITWASVTEKKDEWRFKTYEVAYRWNKIGEMSVSKGTADTEQGIIKNVLSGLKNAPKDLISKMLMMQDFFSSAQEINKISWLNMSFKQWKWVLKIGKEILHKCTYSLDDGKTYVSTMVEKEGGGIQEVDHFNLTALRQLRVSETSNEKIIYAQDKQGKCLLLKVPN